MMAVVLLGGLVVLIAAWAIPRIPDPPLPTYWRVCCDCKAVLQRGNVNLTTHSYCPDCLAKLNREIDKAA